MHQVEPCQKEHSGLRRQWLPNPIARFLIWWASLFALVGPFSVCPFCGQPGCGMGAASAGILGGLAAALMAFPRYLRGVVTRRRSEDSGKAK